MSSVSDQYRGKLLRVNLTDASSKIEDINPHMLRAFIGGRGLGAYLLYREIPANVDPLGPENKLIFTAGPLVGTTAPCSGRFNVNTKSPQTNIYLFSICSGRFGEHMRKSGYDAFVIEGSAPRPVYLRIHDDTVELEDATPFMGMDTEQTEKKLKQAVSGKVSVACIGPAGEARVKTACIMSETRAAGRGGAGAVMGSKNLKALVVGGSNPVTLHDQDGFKTVVKKARDLIKENPFLKDALGPFGTAVSTNLTTAHGVMPVHNWQRGTFDAIDGLVPQNTREKFVKKDKACPACPIGCSKITAVDEGPFAGAETEGPEYETIYAFGTCCDNSSMESIILADQLCDQLGMDTIACGVTIAFAMECFERGILKPVDTDGLDLRFGNAQVIPELLQKMAKREGIGDILADGVLAAAARIGQGTEQYAMHAKGMELGGYDPRGIKSQSLVLACGPRGGCHHAGGYVIQAELVSGQFDRMAVTGKSKLVRLARDLRTVMDSAIYCAFVAASYRLELAAPMIRASTGWDVDEGELAVSGERISNLERMFNVREGLRRKDDILPARVLNDPLPDGPSKDEVIGEDFNTMIDEFYDTCGWDRETGIPLPEQLQRLELDKIVDHALNEAGEP